jgi:cytochrome c-type biogenesis protein CcmH/NrfG
MEPDINQQIIAELQRIRRSVKWGLITFLVIFSTFVAAAIWQGRSRDTAYTEANRAVRALDYRRAADIVERLAAEHPQDYTAFDYLGDVYLRAGDLAKAEEAYSRSDALYPTEESRKILESIRKRRQAHDSATPAASPTGSPSAQPTPQP